MDQYIIVEARSASDLQRRVNEKIAHGYQPWGDLVVNRAITHSPISSSGATEVTKLYQTMVLKEPNKYEY
ncbi:DUF1737 domain-containing protein [Stenotrophomonas phage C121]|uniref:DUF1737 domain-containing protein n=1 Tax=Stenotrophomonas phage C121 TaxID=2914029 RepID=UPI0023290492|nr:DUF1737 domain-containing protein [Stenotrophomonas phage C121]UKL14753.1 DUF1737 domain-containing protein [Stenotrophomonas phage C121]